MKKCSSEAKTCFISVSIRQRRHPLIVDDVSKHLPRGARQQRPLAAGVQLQHLLQSSGHLSGHVGVSLQAVEDQQVGRNYPILYIRIPCLVYDTAIIVGLGEENEAILALAGYSLEPPFQE